MNVRHTAAGARIPKDVRAKAGLPWPVSGTYRCDKCHDRQPQQAGAIAVRCAVLRGEPKRPCNCAYFVLVLNGPGDASEDLRFKFPTS